MISCGDARRAIIVTVTEYAIDRIIRCLTDKLADGSGVPVPRICEGDVLNVLDDGPTPDANRRIR